MKKLKTSYYFREFHFKVFQSVNQKQEKRKKKKMNKIIIKFNILILNLHIYIL